MEGHLASVRIEGGRLIQTFDTPGRSSKPEPASKANSIRFTGGIIRLGKMTLSDTDLELIDQDASDPFDFYPDKLIDQLVAGYSKNTRNGGLRTFMPDFEDLNKTNAR